MPKPHAVMQRQIRERLQGTTGGARVAEIKRLLKELPPFTDGPYGTMRKRLQDELEIAKRRTKHSHHEDSFEVEKEGVRTFQLIGLPNVGKSTLFTALTGKYSRQAAHGYTTAGPVAGLFTWNDAKFQLIDLPAVPLPGSARKGTDVQLLNFIRGQNCQIWVIGLDSDPGGQMEALSSAVGESGERRIVVVGNKADLASGANLAGFERAAGKHPRATAADGESNEKIKELAYSISGLIRIFMRVPGRSETDPMHVDAETAVKEVMEKIHKGMSGRFRSANVWGKSVKFDGQNVGLNHKLADGDILELHLRS